MLSHVSLRNYRAHKKVDLTLEPLTALVGPNGAGKSALLRAIDLVLGERWPSLASMRVQDFTDFDDTSEMIVKVSFTKPLLCEPDALKDQAQIHHLQVCCKPYKRNTKWNAVGDPNFDFEALDAMGNKPMQCVAVREGTKPEFRPLLGVPSAVRAQMPALLIDHQRSMTRQTPWTRGSVLLKLLAPAQRELRDAFPSDVPDEDDRTRREVFSERFEHAMQVLRSPHVEKVEKTINETTRRTLGFLGRTRATDVSVGFGIADPSNPLHSFRLVYREGTTEIPAEEAGLGVQSAIVVGLFEALRQTRAHAGVVLIDEPEMFLHPQAQRYFHDLLVELAEKDRAQVIYSTHSPVFAEAHRFESLRLLRRSPHGYTTVTAAAPSAREALEADRNKLLAHYDASRSEALFADAVLLVEGPGDFLAARELAKQLPVDLDAENLSVVSCGGKSAIPYHARLCRSLGIPVCALYDDDLLPEPSAADASSTACKHRASNARARMETAEIEKALPRKQDRFVCSPSLERLLGVGGSRDKPGRVLAAIVADPQGAPPAVSDAVWRLADLAGCAPAPF